MNGTGVSPGIAIGRARLIQKDQRTLTGILLHTEAERQAEQEKYKQAVRLSTAALETLMERAESAEAADILDSQVELLNDPQMERDVFVKIHTGGKTAHDAVLETIESLVRIFREMPDPYLNARAADIADVGNRILDNLNAVQRPAGESSPIPANSILVAEDLTPSDTVSLDARQVAGFVTGAGGRTSHAAIIARSRGIPAVVGCGPALLEIAQDDLLLLDGETGIVIRNPDQSEIDAYTEKKALFLKRSGLLKALRGRPAVTPDGEAISLLANIGTAADMEQVSEQGGEGVGLLRTELLFLERDDFPSETEQFNFYQAIALQSRGMPVTVRTLDIGGDKQLPHFQIPAEQNPFLGYRAIRISLDRTDIFETQLRAILRASAFGRLSILLPMISDIREIRRAKEILNGVKNELRGRGMAFDEEIRTGIMIEIPAAALMADRLAEEVDFFSIGTNDLCQYTLAADRMNEKIKQLYDPFHPAVLRLIRYVIDQGRQHGIPVAMCGELASDPLATPLLLGMGLREFSMNARSIPAIKNSILRHSLEKAGSICEAVMKMDDSAKIIAYLQTFNT